MAGRSLTAVTVTVTVSLSQSDSAAPSQTWMLRTQLSMGTGPGGVKV